MHQLLSRERDVVPGAGALGCSHCRGMTPAARNVLRADDSMPVSCFHRWRGTRCKSQGTPGDSLRRWESTDFPLLITCHQGSFCSGIFGLCIRSKNPSYTMGCCNGIFPLLPDRVLENRRQREIGRFPSCLNSAGYIISKLLALKLGVKSSISISIPIFCWCDSNPRPQHIQNYELNI